MVSKAKPVECSNGLLILFVMSEQTDKLNLIATTVNRLLIHQRVAINSLFLSHN